MMQLSPFEDEVGPGVANTTQELSLTEVVILVFIEQSGEIWSRYPRITSFWNDFKLYHDNSPNMVMS